MFFQNAETMISKMMAFCFILFILTDIVNAGIFVKGKTHNIDPVGYGGAKDTASLESPIPVRPKRDVEKTKIQSPIALQWSVTEDRLKELKDNQGGHLSSTDFNISNIPGVQYYVNIYPNDDVHPGETWIYLFFSFDGEKTSEADFNISIESADYSFAKKSVFLIAGGHGVKLCTTDELFDREKNFFIDGKIKIKMNGILSIEKEADNVKFWERNSFNDSLGLSLWNHEVDKNVTIYVDGKEITVHSCVLSARSPFFAKMFEFGITEGRVEFVDFTFDIVEKAIRLCYDQNLVNYTTFEQNIQLLHFF